jgi:hypothetical protein
MQVRLFALAQCLLHKRRQLQRTFMNSCSVVLGFKKFLPRQHRGGSCPHRSPCRPWCNSTSQTDKPAAGTAGSGCFVGLDDLATAEPNRDDPLSPLTIRTRVGDGRPGFLAVLNRITIPSTGSSALLGDPGAMGVTAGRLGYDQGSQGSPQRT